MQHLEAVDCRAPVFLGDLNSCRALFVLLRVYTSTVRRATVPLQTAITDQVIRTAQYVQGDQEMISAMLDTNWGRACSCRYACDRRAYKAWDPGYMPVDTYGSDALSANNVV